jgi:carbohydrate-selective porin OprB
MSINGRWFALAAVDMTLSASAPTGRGAANICALLLMSGLSLATPPTASAQTTTPSETGHKYPNLLDGTLSGKGDQEDVDTLRRGWLRFPTLLDPWFSLKQQWRTEHGLTLGGSYGLLWQNYSESLLGETDAVGGKFALNVGYELLNRGQQDALWFELVVEDRRSVGTELTPVLGGLAAGSLSLTTATWGAFDIGITQAYVRQNLADNRFQYAVGKIMAPSFFHAYPFFDDNRQFFNQSFATLLPVPLRGFGGVAAFYPIDDSRFYVQSGMYTLNSDDTGFTADDFFTKAEHFYHVDIGFTRLARSPLPLQALGAMDFNNVHVSGWYRNAQADGTPEAVGIAVNANYVVGGDYMVFGRGGWGNGSLFRGFVSTGVGWRPPTAPADLFGVGFAWAHPTPRPNPATDLIPGLDSLRDQYIVEAFYRFHVTPNLALTPDLQFIVHPALNPSVDRLWAFGFRSRVTF